MISLKLKHYQRQKFYINHILLKQYILAYHSKKKERGIDFGISNISNISSGDLRYAYNLLEIAYYSTDKKASVARLINVISKGDTSLVEKLDAEFLELGKIGNNYQIRHFETGKIPISDIRLKEYWYQRCLSLINLSIKFIEDKQTIHSPNDSIQLFASYVIYLSISMLV